MNCPKCGEKNPADARFCGSCGSPLPVAVASEPAVPRPEVRLERAPAGPSSEMKVLISIATVVIPLIGIVMGVMYMNSPEPAKKSVGRLWLLIGIGATILYCSFSACVASMNTY